MLVCVTLPITVKLTQLKTQSLWCAGKLQYVETKDSHPEMCMSESLVIIMNKLLGCTQCYYSLFPWKVHIISLNNGTCDYCKSLSILILGYKERIWQQSTPPQFSQHGEEMESFCLMEQGGTVIPLFIQQFLNAHIDIDMSYPWVYVSVSSFPIWNSGLT